MRCIWSKLGQRGLLEWWHDTWHSSHLSSGDPFFLSCDRKAWIPFPTKQGNRPSSRHEGPLAYFFGKGIPAFPSHLKRSQSQLETREELQGSCHNSIKTPMCQSTTHKSDSPALTRLSPQVSTPNPMAGVTALWHLKRKPPIPTVNPIGRL